ncbi:hypothetical protein PD885_00421 [Xanthomonas fragariae]|uniref:Secreted protein n=1 Tax=Xanthomonas fragariae TaxID=48664 RepID=A0ABY1RK91_9XANT|nr:hypothetical protein NBC2815_00506 [Xanthomonas fragariae]SMQ97690.1 hypothetical protein PD885_00421 [Xanthomonas fragariae]
MNTRRRLATAKTRSMRARSSVVLPAVAEASVLTVAVADPQPACAPGSVALPAVAGTGVILPVAEEGARRADEGSFRPRRIAAPKQVAS